MTGPDAKELLKAARTTQAEAGPGTLADYPVSGGDAHLLIHYAPGSRAYRFKLTAPGNEASPGTDREPGTVPGNRPGPHGPSRGPETPDGSPAGDTGGTGLRRDEGFTGCRAASRALAAAAELAGGWRLGQGVFSDHQRQAFSSTGLVHERPQ